jgi:hypothetical protein
MARRRGREPAAGRRSSIGSQREWVGGKLLAPMYVTEGEPYRPQIFLWLEMPDGLIIGSTLTHPNEPETSFTDSLHAAMRNPMVGRPQRVRVADASLAAEVHAALGDAVPVTIAPTPELDAIVRELGQGLGGSEEAESYFEAGRVSPEAAEVVRRVRSRLRRRRAVPVERLRDDVLGRYMIQLWDEGVAALARYQSEPPQLCNTDGDAVVVTVDHFDSDPEAREAIEARLAAVQGVEVSRECGGLLRYRVREHCDPLSAAARSGNRADLPASPPPAEAQRLVREFKKRHYASWPDRSLPALGGETPRQAVRKAATWLQVDVLLKDIENHESRLPEAERFDFTALRHELGLE